MPLCGGGDPMIRCELSRQMIRALEKAGGRPLYHEYPGVGHNCWDRVYATADLYEWLLEQRLK